MIDNSRGCRFESCSDQIFRYFLLWSGSLPIDLIKRSAVQCRANLMCVHAWCSNYVYERTDHCMHFCDRSVGLTWVILENMRGESIWSIKSWGLLRAHKVKWRKKKRKKEDMERYNLWMTLDILICWYDSFWMRSNRRSSWVVIGDFCCSVSGLTHFSHLLWTPIDIREILISFIHTFEWISVFDHASMSIELIRHSMAMRNVNWSIRSSLTHILLINDCKIMCNICHFLCW